MTDQLEETTTDGIGGELNFGLHASRIGFRVRLLHYVLSEHVIAALAPYKLRPGSLTTMVMIAANPGYSQIELARIGSLDKSSIVAIVDDLEARGLAVRGRSASDRRRNSLFLTPAGEKLMHEMHAVALATEDPIRKGLSLEDYEKMFELLDRAYQLATSDRAAEI